LFSTCVKGGGMPLFISKEFTFDAAHQLVNYNGKCENLHGHTYKLRITLTGDIDKSGMIIDFNLIKKIVEEKIIEKLDHNFLNNIVAQPTAENILLWIWQELYPVFNFPSCKLYEITLWETENSFVTYRE
jgi:6-pyruvoyltetrahydropterin/6-carboxytetrahydropterin synthase